jgi:hypothetical protein
MTTTFSQSSLLCRALLWDADKNDLPLTLLGLLDVRTLFETFPLVCKQFRPGFFLLGQLGKSPSTHEESTVAISRFLLRNRDSTQPCYTRCLVKEFPNISVRVFTIASNPKFDSSSVYCMAIQVFKVITPEITPPQTELDKYRNSYMYQPFMSLIYDQLSRFRQVKSSMLQKILLTGRLMRAIGFLKLEVLHLYHCPLHPFLGEKIGLKDFKAIQRLHITLIYENQQRFVQLPLNVSNLVVFCSNPHEDNVGAAVMKGKLAKDSTFLIEAQHCDFLHNV